MDGHDHSIGSDDLGHSRNLDNDSPVYFNPHVHNEDLSGNHHPTAYNTGMYGIRSSTGSEDFDIGQRLDTSSSVHSNPNAHDQWMGEALKLPIFDTGLIWPIDDTDARVRDHDMAVAFDNNVSHKVSLLDHLVVEADHVKPMHPHADQRDMGGKFFVDTSSTATASQVIHLILGGYSSTNRR